MAFPEERMKTVYTVVDGKGERSRWVRIGIGFINQDESINVRLDAVPVNGTLQIRNFTRRDRDGFTTSTQEVTDPGRAGFALEAKGAM